MLVQEGVSAIVGSQKGWHPHIHSFARQFLAQQGCKIFADDAEILTPFKGPYGGKIYEISEIDTKIPIGSTDFRPSEQIRRVTNHQQVYDLGFKIVSTQFTAWFKGQKHRYDIVQSSSVKTALKDIPAEHFVEFDTINRVLRLRGKNAGWNGVGNWVFLPNSPLKKRKQTDTDYVKSYLTDRSRLMGEKSEQKYLDIKEIPVMIDENGLIICIEEQMNEPCIGIVGQRRMGNSFLMHAITDRAFWKWGKRIAVMNDGLDETDTWCLPWQQHPSQPNQFIRNLALLNEPTLPLPCVYLTPNYYGTKEEDIFYPREVGFKISLPLKEMIEDWTNFTKGNSRWTFKNSLTYFQNILFNDDGTLNERLIKATSFEELELLMQEKWFNAKGELDKKYETIYMKVGDTLRNIWNWKILDASYGTPSKWKVILPNKYETETDPFVASLLCGIVPVLLTRKIKDFQHFPMEFKYRLERVFKAQMDDPYLSKMKIQTWLIIDEILSIAATDNKTVAGDAIEKVVRESGPARLGIVYRAQNYSKVLRDLKKNTGFVFAFNQDEESAKAILKDFGTKNRKAYMEDMTSLKRHQVMAFTKSKFIAYDPITGERTEIDDKPIKGTTLPIPPLSQHKPPKQYGT